MFLNEETSQTETINDFVVTEEYTGEDTELLTIMVEHEQYMHNLSIAMMRAEHRSIVEEDTALYEQAKEGFFKRAGDHIKKFWARVVAFFKALWYKVSTLFADRHKWVKEHKDDIVKGAPKTSMRLPSRFKQWGGSDKRVEEYQAKVIRVIGNVKGLSKDMVKEANNHLTGKMEEVVNYSEFFNEQIGEMTDTRLGSVVNEILYEVLASENAKFFISLISKTEKEFLSKVAQLNKQKEKIQQPQNLSNINKVSTMVVSFLKALHNTAIRMGNYGWQACRKAASAANLKEGTDVTEKEEGKDLTNETKNETTNESDENTNTNENVNESEKKDYKDILSQYMDE